MTRVGHGVHHAACASRTSRVGASCTCIGDWREAAVSPLTDRATAQGLFAEDQTTVTPTGDVFVKPAVRKGLLPAILAALTVARAATRDQLKAATRWGAGGARWGGLVTTARHCPQRELGCGQRSAAAGHLCRGWCVPSPSPPSFYPMAQRGAAGGAGRPAEGPQGHGKRAVRLHG